MDFAMNKDLMYRMSSTTHGRDHDLDREIRAGGPERAGESFGSASPGRQDASEGSFTSILSRYEIDKTPRYSPGYDEKKPASNTLSKTGNRFHDSHLVSDTVQGHDEFNKSIFQASRFELQNVRSLPDVMTNRQAKTNNLGVSSNIKIYQTITDTGPNGNIDPFRPNLVIRKVKKQHLASNRNANTVAGNVARVQVESTSSSSSAPVTDKPTTTSSSRFESELYKYAIPNVIPQNSTIYNAGETANNDANVFDLEQLLGSLNLTDAQQSLANQTLTGQSNTVIQSARTVLSTLNTSKAQQQMPSRANLDELKTFHVWGPVESDVIIPSATRREVKHLKTRSKVTQNRGYASDSEDSLTWLEQQRERLEERRRLMKLAQPQPQVQLQPEQLQQLQVAQINQEIKQQQREQRLKLQQRELSQSSHLEQQLQIERKWLQQQTKQQQANQQLIQIQSQQQQQLQDEWLQPQQPQELEQNQQQQMLLKQQTQKMLKRTEQERMLKQQVQIERENLQQQQLQHLQTKQYQQEQIPPEQHRQLQLQQEWLQKQLQHQQQPNQNQLQQIDKTVTYEQALPTYPVSAQPLMHRRTNSLRHGGGGAPPQDKCLVLTEDNDLAKQQVIDEIKGYSVRKWLEQYSPSAQSTSGYSIHDRSFEFDVSRSPGTINDKEQSPTSGRRQASDDLKVQYTHGESRATSMLGGNNSIRENITYNTIQANTTRYDSSNNWSTYTREQRDQVISKTDRRNVKPLSTGKLSFFMNKIKISFMYVGFLMSKFEIYN